MLISANDANELEMIHRVDLIISEYLWQKPSSLLISTGLQYKTAFSLNGQLATKQTFQTENDSATKSFLPHNYLHWILSHDILEFNLRENNCCDKTVQIYCVSNINNSGRLCLWVEGKRWRWPHCRRRRCRRSGISMAGEQKMRPGFNLKTTCGHSCVVLKDRK